MEHVILLVTQNQFTYYIWNSPTKSKIVIAFVCYDSIRLFIIVQR